MVVKQNGVYIQGFYSDDSKEPPRSIPINKSQEARKQRTDSVLTSTWMPNVHSAQRL